MTDAPFPANDTLRTELAEAEADADWPRWRPAYSLLLVVGSCGGFWGVVAGSALHVMGVL